MLRRLCYSMILSLSISSIFGQSNLPKNGVIVHFDAQHKPYLQYHGVVFGVGGWTPLGFGLAGCVTGGAVCAPGGVVCCVCANAIGEASKSAAAVKASVRFIGILRGAPSHPEPTSPRPRGFREEPYHSAIPTHAHASKASAACA